MSRKDIAVIVQETPIHKVEVRTGVMGKRGPKGDEGPIGPRGFTGPKGDPAKQLEIEITDEQLININGLNHGIQYITTNSDYQEVVVFVGKAEQIVEGETRENKGAVVLFTQGSEAELIIQGAPEVSVIVPKDCLPKAYGIGSSIGLISKSVNEWILVGDLAMDEIVIENNLCVTAPELTLKYNTSLTGINNVRFELRRRNYFTDVPFNTDGNLLIQIDNNAAVNFFNSATLIGNSTYQLDINLSGEGIIKVTGDLSSNIDLINNNLYLTLDIMSVETWGAAITEVVSFGEIPGLENVTLNWAFNLIKVPCKISPYFKSTDSMFYLCTSLNDPIIGSWDVSNVETMDLMFYGAEAFNQNLTCWKVQNIPSEPYQFYLESGLQTNNLPLWGQANNDSTGRTGNSCQ